jgi:hypothetical protein
LSSLEDLERRSLGIISDSNMDEDSESEEGDEGDEKEEKEAGDAGPSNAGDTNMTEGDQPSTSLSYETDAIFVVIDPTRQDLGQTSRELLSDASNITLLRLFNDVFIGPSPPLPADAPKRIKPGHRLIDEDGCQVSLIDPVYIDMPEFVRRRFMRDQDFGYGTSIA